MKNLIIIKTFKTDQNQDPWRVPMHEVLPKENATIQTRYPSLFITPILKELLLDVSSAGDPGLTSFKSGSTLPPRGRSPPSTTAPPGTPLRSKSIKPVGSFFPISPNSKIVKFDESIIIYYFKDNGNEDRKGYWIENRCHFQRHCNQIQDIISFIFQDLHRHRIQKLIQKWEKNDIEVK